MKVVVMQPGVMWSVHDLYTGIVPALRRLGHEVVEYNLAGRINLAGQWLKAAWAQSSKSTAEPGDADALYFANTGVLERALGLDAEWVIVVSGLFTPPQFYPLLRRAGRKVAVIFTESPYMDDEWQLMVAGLVDACWVNELTSVARFQAVNPHSYYWQHAIDPIRHLARTVIPEDVPRHDVVFVGTAWEERIEILEAIDWTGIDVGFYGAWDLLDKASPLAPLVHECIVPNERTGQLYRAAKIGINFHRLCRFGEKGSKRIAYAESINPRCYELAAAGCFFVSDWRKELETVFGGIVPTFASASELETAIHYWLEHDEERREVAAKLPNHIMDHTFDMRMREMMRALEQVRPMAATA